MNYKTKHLFHQAGYILEQIGCGAILIIVTSLALIYERIASLAVAAWSLTFPLKIRVKDAILQTAYAGSGSNLYTVTVSAKVATRRRVVKSNDVFMEWEFLSGYRYRLIEQGVQDEVGLYVFDGKSRRSFKFAFLENHQPMAGITDRWQRVRVTIGRSKSNWVTVKKQEGSP